MTMFRGGSASGGRGGRGGGDRGGRGFRGGRGGRGGDRDRGGRGGRGGQGDRGGRGSRGGDRGGRGSRGGDRGGRGRGRGGDFERQKRPREDEQKEQQQQQIDVTHQSENPPPPAEKSGTSDRKQQEEGAPAPGTMSEQTFSKPSSAPRKGKTLVIILAKAGLILGAKGMVDAYERSISTAISNDSVADVRPDIVHQCLLSVFDSNMSYYGNVKVYIETTKGKTIQINPKWRPPRTFQRFRGLMENLFRDGKIVSDQGEVLLSFMRGTVAPIVPHGAEVVALSNEATASVVRPNQFAENMMDSPVPDNLQGGLKNCYGFVVVSCQENGNLAGIPLVSDSVCLSPYPMSPHVMLSRMCEGFANQLQLGLN